MLPYCVYIRGLYQIEIKLIATQKQKNKTFSMHRLVTLCLQCPGRLADYFLVGIIVSQERKYIITIKRGVSSVMI